MISSTLGAPLGGTIVGGHHGLESLEFSLITPPNLGSGTGIWLPWIVVVALGEPNSPVATCAAAGPQSAVRPRRTTRLLLCNRSRRKRMRCTPLPILRKRLLRPA